MYCFSEVVNSILRYYSVTNNIDENSFSWDLIHAAQEALMPNLETKTEEKKDHDASAPISLMTR